MYSPVSKYFFTAFRASSIRKLPSSRLNSNGKSVFLLGDLKEPSVLRLLKFCQNTLLELDGLF